MWAATVSRFGWPSWFCGNRALKPITSLTAPKLAAVTWSLCVEMNQVTSSLHGGVVREPT